MIPTPLYSYYIMFLSKVNGYNCSPKNISYSNKYNKGGLKMGWVEFIFGILVIYALASARF
jgi:hypothetical protein